MKLNELNQALQNLKDEGLDVNFIVKPNSIILYSDYTTYKLTESAEPNKFNAWEVDERDHQITDEETWDLEDLMYTLGYC